MITTDRDGAGRLTVGQVADTFGVTVRTLHHYDEVGLLRPSDRSPAGYRLYSSADLTRLRDIVVYRRLGFLLEEIATLLAEPEQAASHLRRQRAVVMSRLDELRELVGAIDRALEKEMSDQQLSPQDMRDLFGDGPFDDSYAAEAERRWGDTPQWEQGSERTASYGKAEWTRIKQETDELNTGFAAALAAGVPANSPQAMDLAEQHRRHINTWFYDLDHVFHVNLAGLYVGDARFIQGFEDVAAGLARFVHDAIIANAARHSS